ncbi:MAG: metalloregulator ArsR/SmtB family transcription factor [Actinomycetales bacterium]|nr:metalloregulator ArsR/SmtB family transcription factor [Actinomycetales bacterium]
MTEETDALDVLFSALANRHRREIIHALALQPHSISQLAAMRGLSLPAIHKHLAILADAGLVTRRKTGRTTHLALERHSLRALQYWLSEFHAYWGTSEETLENYEQYLAQSPPTSKE